MRAPLCVASLLIASSARADVVGIEQAIVGGQVLGGPVPPTALIGTCDATLIAPLLLVTAAHCTWDEPEHAWFGRSQQQATLSVEISHCVAHPDFAEQPLGNDIAYCLLRGDTSAIEPAWLGEVDVGAQVTMVGHGYESAAMGERIARSVQVRVDDLHDGELVVGDRAHGACHGDSGGGVYSASTLVGVISRRGPEGDSCASSTLVTPIAPHRAWLEAASESDGCALHTRTGSSPWLLLLSSRRACRRLWRCWRPSWWRLRPSARHR